MLPALAIVLGAVIGFVGSRKLRRPQHAAQAASVARTVGGSLGARKGLTAPELQRACFSEMERHVRSGPAGAAVVPSSYVLRLHPDDLATVDDARGWFVDGLVDALRTAAADNGWQLVTNVDISFEADSGRRPGVPVALAVESPAPPAPDRPSARVARVAGALIRTDTGARIGLTGHEITIGRAAERTIVIDDTRVSRSHATMVPGRNGWTITDTGSSNGTTVNGRLLTPNVPQPLAAGDTIGIGPIELRVVAS